MNKILIFLFLSGCASSKYQQLDPKIYYRRDMQIKVNGFQGLGVLVVPKADMYKFDIKSSGKLDMFTLSTCHREQTQEKAGRKTWFGNKKRRKFEFIPAPIEAESTSCPVEIGGYEARKGRHSWAIIEFEHDKMTLPALLSCNGSITNTRGVSICQSFDGSLQEISFSEEVIVAKKNVCIELTSPDNKVFRFKMPNRECTFRFVTKSGVPKWHRLVTIGYEKILVREE